MQTLFDLKLDDTWLGRYLETCYLLTWMTCALDSWITFTHSVSSTSYYFKLLYSEVPQIDTQKLCCFTFIIIDVIQPPRIKGLLFCCFLLLAKQPFLRQSHSLFFISSPCHHPQISWIIKYRPHAFGYNYELMGSSIPHQARVEYLMILRRSSVRAFGTWAWDAFILEYYKMLATLTVLWTFSHHFSWPRCYSCRDCCVCFLSLRLSMLTSWMILSRRLRTRWTVLLAMPCLLCCNP